MSDSKTSTLQFQPIGVVRSPFVDALPDDWRDRTATVVLDAAYRDGLRGLDGFSHLYVVFALDRSQFDPDEHMLIRPERREDFPLVGVFSCRSPRRPNPIGLTLVELVGIEGATLTVRGLDAYHCSPVLDIKPHFPPRPDAIEPRVPDWAQTLRDQGPPAH